MKIALASALVFLVSSVLCVFRQDVTTKRPILNFNQKQVRSPGINFQCGRRGSIAINFGFGSPFQARQKRSTGRVPVAALDKPNKPTIVGGQISYRNSWPWMVLLGRKVGPSNNFFCSGVLINSQYVLTAAHCVLELAPFFARLGEHDYTASGGNSRAPEDVRVKDVVFHPKYDITKGYHDVAVLKLARPVVLRNEIGPICLPWGNIMNEDLVNQKVTVTGWGTVEFGGLPSRVLQEVKIDVFDPSVCHKSYSTLSDFVKAFPNGMNRGNIVCAGALLGGKDACQGDSGGPMVHQGSGSTYTLAGIISKGYGCGKAGFPGLYAPIRNYDTLAWIKKTAF